MVRLRKRRFIQSKLNDDQDVKKWWQLVKSLTNKAGNTSSSSTIINDRRVNDDELCSELNCYFKSVGGQLQQVVSTSYPCDAGDSSPLEHVSIGEIKLMLKQIDTSKSCNSNDFPSLLSVDGREDLCILLHHIINAMLNTGEYPDLWTEAEVQPLPKIKTTTETTDLFLCYTT